MPRRPTKKVEEGERKRREKKKEKSRQNSPRGKR